MKLKVLKRGLLSSVAALSLVIGAQSGCSSKSEPDVTVAPDSPVLNGDYVYQGTGDPPGGIKQISFFNQSYSMFVDCAEGQTDGCFDYGRFAASADGTSLTFTSTLDGKVRTLPFQLGARVTATPSGTSLEDERLRAAQSGLTGKSGQAGQVAPQDLVSSDAGALISDGGGLVNTSVPIVSTFGMGGDGGSNDFCLVCSLSQGLVQTDGGPDADAQAEMQGSTNEIPGDPSFDPGPDEEITDQITGGMTGMNKAFGSGVLDDPTMGSTANTNGNGSHVTNNSSTYDIYAHECHNAANYGVTHASGPGKWGVLSCYGNLPLSSNAGHTYNYVVSADHKVTFWNWGSSCTATDKTYGAPPDVTSGDALVCVKKFCGSQYNAPGSANAAKGYQTVALAPGQLVQRASPSNCTMKAQQAESDAISSQASSVMGSLMLGIMGTSGLDSVAFDSCNSCCNQYANYWKEADGAPTMPTQRTNYLTHCLAQCRVSFK